MERADSVYKLLVKHRNELDQHLTSLAGGIATSRSVRSKGRRRRGREGEREGGRRKRERALHCPTPSFLVGGVVLREGTASLS